MPTTVSQIPKLHRVPKRAARDRVHSYKAPAMRERAERFASVGLEHRAAALLNAVARAEAITVSQHKSEVELKHFRIDLVDRVAAGALSPEEASLEYDAAERRTVTAPVAADIANAATRRILRETTLALWDAGDDLILELDLEAQRFVETIAAANLGDVASDGEAVKAGSGYALAWAEAVTALGQLERTWRLADRLRTDGLVARLDTAWFPTECMQYRNASALRSGLGAGTHPLVRRRAEIKAGAKPGCLTATEALELYSGVPVDRDPLTEELANP